MSWITCGVLVVVVTTTTLVAFAFQSGFFEKRSHGAYGDLAAACEGRPIPGAKRYIPGPGVHLAVAAHRAPTGWYIDNNLIPRTQTPERVADTEAVACLDEETQRVVGACEVRRARSVNEPGRNEILSRTQKILPVRVVVAATGQTLAVGHIVGQPPPPCETLGGDPSSSDVQGESISALQLGPWLSIVLANGGTGMTPTNPN